MKTLSVSRVLRKSICIWLLLFSLPMLTDTQSQGSAFKLYLIRHAEKVVSEDKDPDLTDKGLKRADALAEFISHDDSLQRIYSTQYKRTQATALPSAQRLKLEVVVYDPRQLEDFARQLIENRETALIIGHSNTTPTLIDLLGGDSEPIDEKRYGDLYVLEFAQAASQPGVTRKILIKVN